MYSLFYTIFHTTLKQKEHPEGCSLLYFFTKALIISSFNINQNISLKDLPIPYRAELRREPFRERCRGLHRGRSF